MAKNYNSRPHSDHDHIPYSEWKTTGGSFEKRSLSDRFTDWYDRQSLDIIFLLAVSPLIFVGVVIVACALIWGR